jgi:hypothetical protein
VSGDGDASSEETTELDEAEEQGEATRDNFNGDASKSSKQTVT